MAFQNAFYYFAQNSLSFTPANSRSLRSGGQAPAIAQSVPTWQSSAPAAAASHARSRPRGPSTVVDAIDDAHRARRCTLGAAAVIDSRVTSRKQVTGPDPECSIKIYQLNFGYASVWVPAPSTLSSTRVDARCIRPSKSWSSSKCALVVIDGEDGDDDDDVWRTKHSETDARGVE
ncbi:hypothetical protein PLICRDRAFT_181273 [Plicaturopsis crispa FD-325 SS-3]|uniref:Uncharacterized protein n=1 Tax=Plicaturopsis crispa FD-325 SS-3 TaxID=944288 RepID=A0A0C9SUS7_PLICR|nr:hypothetical protein PLICRDRAFT_181273 [Plicaturopsis crispa FD-325 SS-3]